MNLAGAANATIATSQGIGTISNDDVAAPLTVGIANASLIEGNSGTVNATFKISLSAAATQNVTVNYTTSNGTAASASDYLAASGIVTFLPGETSKTVTIKVIGETLLERAENFFVTLSNPVNAGLGSAIKATGTILNDDTSIWITDVSRSLVGGSGTDFTFTITLTHSSALTTSVRFATADGRLRSPGGYNATSGTLTFAPGETSKTVNVKVKKAVKGDFFFMNLSAPVNGTIADSQGVGTVI